MIFDNVGNVDAGTDPISTPISDEIDAILDRDPDTPEGIENIAADVENIMMQNAIESAQYFENGKDSVDKFLESAEVQALVEARKLSKKTYVRLSKSDDLNRREHLAAILIAKEKNDPLFHKLALNRVMERKLRKAIFAKYSGKATLTAKKSQKQHIKAMKSMPALPVIKQ